MVLRLFDGLMYRASGIWRATSCDIEYSHRIRPEMVLSTLLLVYFAASATYLTIDPTGEEQTLITPGPNWDDLKKQYVFYVHHHMDYVEVSICAVIPYSVGHL